MVYLMDSVTGHLLRVFQHRRCRGPVKVVHSENWVMVSGQVFILHIGLLK